MTVVRAIEPVLSRALGETSRLAIRLDPDLGAVKADRGQLEQVLLNLALNARDAMPAGGRLSLETANIRLDRAYVEAKGLEAMKPGLYARLVVSDTGHGMDRETLEHVFEPFFTTKAVGEGTGLGLATVYGIVRQSGGFIWAYSEPGTGTTFKIYLPLIDAPVMATSASRALSVAGGRETLLVAEDDDAVRDVLARSLREYGYTVLEARDGQHALEVATAAPAPPDLVVADVVMPGLAGRGIGRMSSTGAGPTSWCSSPRATPASTRARAGSWRRDGSSCRSRSSPTPWRPRCGRCSTRRKPEMSHPEPTSHPSEAKGA